MQFSCIFLVLFSRVWFIVTILICILRRLVIVSFVMASELFSENALVRTCAYVLSISDSYRICFLFVAVTKLNISEVFDFHLLKSRASTTFSYQITYCLLQFSASLLCSTRDGFSLFCWAHSRFFIIWLILFCPSHCFLSSSRNICFCRWL